MMRDDLSPFARSNFGGYCRFLKQKMTHLIAQVRTQPHMTDCHPQCYHETI